MVREPLEVMMDSFTKFGDTYTIYAGGKTKTIMTKDAEFIQYVLQKHHKNYKKSKIASETLAKYTGKGLLTSDGEYWLRQRRLIQPGFHLDKIKALYEIMANTIEEFLKTFPTGEAVDVYPLMNKAAFKIVINSLFEIQFGQEKEEALADAVSAVQNFIVKEVRQPYKNWWFKLSGITKNHVQKARHARDIIKEVIQERQQSGETCNDLLDMLLSTRYEDTGKPMSIEHLVDELFILIVAGHETTANALSWTLYLLSNHPELLNEVTEHSKENDLSSIVKNEHLLAVINESMRLYPPAWISDRVSLADDAFKSFSFPKDTPIMVVFYALHRDPKFWPEPNVFNPSRFLKDNLTKEQTKAFFPFGAGPRLCIGNNFAMAEMAIFLQKFIHQFQVGKTSQIPRKLPLVTLRPDEVLLNIQRIA